MPLARPSAEHTERPELFFGLAAAVGAPAKLVVRALTDLLTARGYSVEKIHLSGLMDAVCEGPWEVPTPEFERIGYLMDKGNDLRAVVGGGQALAMLAAVKINSLRRGANPVLEGKAFILDQLKHPEEVYRLRSIYGDAFHLVGIYCSEPVRRRRLESHYGMSEAQAIELIERDRGERPRLGQQLRETFHLSDVFIDAKGPDDPHEVTTQLGRYVRLLFGDQSQGIETPSPEEYGMYLASAAALRSADLSRQVGAAILTDTHEVVSLGTNEVPAAGGGQYWPSAPNDDRDFQRDEDSSKKMRVGIIEEILNVIDGDFSRLAPEQQAVRAQEVSVDLSASRVMNLTEFGRAVHAEMDALLAAGRLGVPTRGCALYTTTFPCHNCAKHVISSGVSRVTYIEPYPKSLAMELHSDAIFLDDIDEASNEGARVVFRQFVGVSPRRYPTLFSIRASSGKRIRRKDTDGRLAKESLGLRTHSPSTTYVEREAIAAQELKSITE